MFRRREYYGNRKIKHIKKSSQVRHENKYIGRTTRTARTGGDKVYHHKVYRFIIITY